MQNLSVWPEAYPTLLDEQLKQEAHKHFRIHQLPEEISKWEEQRIQLREKIWQSLGSKPDHSLPLNFEIFKTIQMDGYKIQNITYQSRENFYVTGNLYIPNNINKVPGVINMHGHWAQGRLAERIQSRGHTLAKNGYVCLCVDAFGSGERSTTHGEYEYHGAHLGASLLDIGETLMGMQVVDNMRGVDLLCSLGFVDSDNIGATGASGGGNQTMWLTAMDERVKSAVPVVSVGSFESYIGACNCVCELLPQGLTYTEESGVLALIAPRALKICNALKDSNPAFYADEMLRSFKETRKVFKLYGKDQSLTYQTFNTPHGYWPEIQEAMLGWFDYTLKGQGTGLPHEERPFQTLEEEELMCFKKGERPEKVVSIPEFCRKQGDILRTSILNAKEQCPQTKQKELEKLLKVDLTIDLKKYHEHGNLTFNDRTWQKITLETSSGRIIPVLFFDNSEQSTEICILSHGAGKDKLKDTPALKELYQENCSIIIADLCCTGESGGEIDERLGAHHDTARSCWWLGKSLMGEWIHDLKVLHDFALKKQDNPNINLIGIKEAAVASLFASIFIDSIHNIKLYECPLSYTFTNKPETISLAIHIPKLLTWGDISLATALTNKDIALYKPCKMDGTPYNNEEVKAFIAETKHLCNFLTTNTNIRVE